MTEKITEPFLDISCPLCLSKKQDSIILKNFKRSIDSYFLKIETSKIRSNYLKSLNYFDLKSTPHFFKCLNCNSIYRNPIFILPESEEHTRYGTHNNSLLDPKYLQYLGDSIKPFLNFIMPNQSGLDFGCGPTKGIEHLLSTDVLDNDTTFKDSKEFKINNIRSYDKYFFPELKLGLGSNFNLSAYKPLIPSKTNAIHNSNCLFFKSVEFDYIFCHEVVEHFVKTINEFENLFSFLKTGGHLFIRTETYPEDLNQFEDWYYKNDSTHVFFLSISTFKFIAKKYNFEFLILDKNKFILKRN